MSKVTLCGVKLKEKFNRVEVKRDIIAFSRFKDDIFSKMGLFENMSSLNWSCQFVWLFA